MPFMVGLRGAWFEGCFSALMKAYLHDEDR